MADGPLHPGRCGGKPLGNFGIEYFRHGVDDIHIIHGNHDGLPQILIPLDMGRHADLVNDRRHQVFQGYTAVHRSRGRHGKHCVHPVQQRVHRAGLGHEIAHAQLPGLGENLIGTKGREQDHPGLLTSLSPQLTQRVHAVQLRKCHVHHHQIRFVLMDQLLDLCAAAGYGSHIKLSRLFNGFPQHAAEFLVGIRQQNRFSVLHIVPCPFSNNCDLRRIDGGSNRVFYKLS